MSKYAAAYMDTRNVYICSCIFVPRLNMQLHIRTGSIYAGSIYAAAYLYRVHIYAAAYLDIGTRTFLENRDRAWQRLLITVEYTSLIN